MSKLLYPQHPQALSPGVTLLQEITKTNAPLAYIELKLIELTAGGSYQETLTEFECCAVILTGKATLTSGDQQFTDIGTRESVFDKVPTDSVYLPRESQFTVTSQTKAKVILCYSPTTVTKELTFIPAKDNTTEARGILNNQRLVHNILPDSSTIADRLLVVEVYTEGGNFSSYPPHKHDQDNLPEESLLEETYYHEINPPQGFVFQRVYTDDRSLDETMSVENGSVVAVPKGYHPVGVPDGYTSYYLNIMAGPVRKWQFHNDPDHEWILNR
ncbi:5-deoxy-glucuronate isomerase [Vagococcus sp. BWB3-3]|uniref:5-deoxy-glucuronate isomerase n=1 Tax=Vagococcus allomyrinae TaxID=2794353 RepID=A0A940SVL8_9ENTE|nr:5-deoxy-glucuronate isomerase [Vagococcus allomyrinae]MBP1041201.1 5-deoxy-glucuronate isomerase [Vagococcus allomyrinae]